MRLITLLITLLVGAGVALSANMRSRRPIRSTQAPKESVSNYEVVTPVITFSDGKKPHPSVLHVLIDTETEKYNIVLELNEMLIPPNFSSRSYDKDGQEVRTKGYINCFYQGWVEGHPEWRATMSSCGGLKGTFGNHQNKSELYHLQPLSNNDPALEQAHALFLDLEYNEDPGTCGCNNTQLIDKIGGVTIPDIIEELNASGRMKRQVNGYWIVELTIVSDNRQYIAFERNLQNTVNRALEITNIVDNAYRLLGYRVILVESIVWSAGDPINIEENPIATLNSFRNYITSLPDSVERDCLHLLTGMSLGLVVGVAFTGVMCNEAQCAGVSRDGGRVLGLVGETVAHELGHNFNMSHDNPNCICNDPAGYCIMRAMIQGTPATQWSTCSVDALDTFFTTSNLDCLSNQPSTMVADPVCGNGLREGNETCDCGTPAECMNPCCNATTCQLAAEAQCAGGECCMPQCTFSTAGTTCRMASGTCDITEFCTGTSSDCPSDELLLDGTECTRNGASAFCYSGVCPNRDLTCQAAYGSGSQNGIDQCYEQNANVSTPGQCYHEASVRFDLVNRTLTLVVDRIQCATVDVECGLMWCENGTFMLSDLPYVLNTLPINQFVCASYFSVSGALGAGYVTNGNACGTGWACFNRHCVLPSQLTNLTCPNGSNGLPCSGNGQCNNNGGCSCNIGFSGLTCQTGAIECPPLPGIANGMISYSPDMTPNFTLSTNATYSCDEGFFLDLSVGDEVRTCEDDNGMGAIGQFSGIEPTCVPIQCPPLPEIANGRISYSPDMTPNFVVGTVATYTCDDGFFLDISSGNAMRTCEVDNGMDVNRRFSGEAPSCVVIECPPLPGIANGRISYSPDMTPNYTLSTNAIYSCDEGFFLDVSIGDEVRTCEDDNGMDAVGRFSGDEPLCIPIQCPPLPEIANGRISYSPDMTPNFVIGTVATYNCNDGFFLDISSGNAMRTCKVDNGMDAIGRFSGEAPSCVTSTTFPPPMTVPLPTTVPPPTTFPPLTMPPTPTPDQCGNACNPFGASCINIDSLGFRCVCNPGFGGNGFICLDFDECRDGTNECDENAVCTNTHGNYTCECRPGYSGNGFSCNAIQCPPLPEIANGRISYSPDMTPNFVIGTVATYTCDDGFFLDMSSGNATRTCEVDNGMDVIGRFSGEAPSCVNQCGNACHLDASCINIDSLGFHCVCNPGFGGNGFICLDFDECRDGTNECDENAVCTNTHGNYTCECRPGYSGNGFSCNAVIQVNETVIPLMTVPLNIQNKLAIMPLDEDDIVNLCYELHGRSGVYFNLVSDDCVSVNAHYQQIAPGEDINIIDEIAVLAVDTGGECQRIEVSLDGCQAMVNDIVINDTYTMNGISVRKYPSRTRITVPNCGSVRGLVMWVMCQQQTFWSTSKTNEDGSELTFEDDAIRFVIAHGLNLRETSHGIIGQFWNIPIEVTPYNGPFNGLRYEPVFNVNIFYPGEMSRTFFAELRRPSWEFEQNLYCLYAGDDQAGPVFEVPDGSANGPVIEGYYSEYIVGGKYETQFRYSHFNEQMCIA